MLVFNISSIKTMFKEDYCVIAGFKKTESERSLPDN
jgi:hypothetical protein